MAKSAATKFNELVGQSVQKRKEVAILMEGEIPSLVEALLDRAKGVRCVKEGEDKEGNPKPYYYTRAPDAVSIKMVFDLTGVYPERFAEMALNVARTELALADALLRPAMKQKAIAETQAAITNTALSSLTLITEEHFNDATSKLIEGGLAIMARTTQEELAAAGESEAEYQKMQQVWAGRFATLYDNMIEEKDDDEEDE